MIAGLELRDVRADRLDDAGGLVAEDRRRRERIVAVDEVQVAVAHAAGDRAHEHLAPDGLVDLDVLDRQGLVGTVEDGGFHGELLSSGGTLEGTLRHTTPDVNVSGPGPLERGVRSAASGQGFPSGSRSTARPADAQPVKPTARCATFGNPISRSTSAASAERWPPAQYTMMRFVGSILPL